MESTARKFPYAFLWVMILSPIILMNVVAFLALLKGNQSAGPVSAGNMAVSVLLVGCILSEIIAWVIIQIDIIKNKFHNKTFWILSMFFIPVIAEIVYLIRRKKLLNIPANPN
jgi:hypothetical protein